MYLVYTGKNKIRTEYLNSIHLEFISSEFVKKKFYCFINATISKNNPYMTVMLPGGSL